MKRFVLFPILAIYLLSGSGVVINSFYCCDQLQSVTLFQNASQEISCKKTEKLPGCCKNKVQFYKVTDNHFVSPSIDVHAFSIVYECIAFKSQNLDVFRNLSFQVLKSHGPPSRRPVPLYIFNNSFRI